ncbi:MAG: NAD(+) synthase [Clostridia bacterium]|nr:NAD(+) synthase [Clostridia bacterium]
MKDGIVRLGCGIPAVKLADPKSNADEIINLVRKAAYSGVRVLALPELCLTGATCGDLFFNPTLLEGAKLELDRILQETCELEIIFFVGMPLSHNGKIYNAYVTVCHGQVMGIAAKASPADFGDCADSRWFTPAPESGTTVMLGEATCYLGNNVVYSDVSVPELKIAPVFAADLEKPDSPIANLAGTGATVIVCPDASPEIIARNKWKQDLISVESGKTLSAILYANAGSGESTTDLVYSGAGFIAAGGTLTAKKLPFSTEDLIACPVDLSHLLGDRARSKIYTKDSFNAITTGFALFPDETDISGTVDPLPFIPKTEEDRKATCARILEIQSRGLARRIEAAHASGAVVAISGGLDSCLALLVTAKAFDILNRDRKNILTVTMPCYGTTKRTRGNAEQICDELGTTFKCIDIAEAVALHFRDIGHSPEDHSVVYENSQARERTQIIMDIANGTNAIVVGTGDLSELALGWATYNGDHMSNYGVNGGIPKTLIRHVVAYCAETAKEEGKDGLAEVLNDILATPVSPELLPAKDGEISQKTEDIVGPYELHDFFIYRMIRYSERPAKLYRMALAAFKAEDGFTPEVIHKWLKIFTRRFFIQQFKRSCLPDGPKVGAVALSPRGEWKMASDAEFTLWMDEVNAIDPAKE